jgi:hypothetical protein
MKNVTFTTQRSLSRRAMLKGTGITLALPWLDAMSAAFAEAPKPPMRFIGILNYFSFHAPNLFPKEAGANYIATPYLEGLQPHRNEFTVISGLNHPEVRDGHSSDKSFFTGAPHPGSPSFKNTISLDQLAAEQIGRDTRYTSLNFSTSGAFSCSYTRSGVAIPPETSPARAFARLFIDGTPAEVAEEVARVQEGRSILDRVAAEAKRLEKTIGPGDREKLDQYFTSVRELEERMVRSENFAKQPKPKPDVPAVKDPGSGEDTTRFGLMLEVARLAVQTDLTRIVTLYYVGTSKTPSKPGTSYAYHDLSHHGQDQGKLAQLAILERDLLLEWGKFIGRMKESKDGASRLLDHTMSVFGAGMGNASSHESTNLPVLLTGGRFKHGQHLAHDPKSPPPLCNLWVQVLREMGVAADRFGTSDAEALAGLDA